MMRASVAGWLALLSAFLAASAPADPFQEKRESMVRLVADYSPQHRVRDRRVLAAMRRVPRHEFIPPENRRLAYADTPVAIGEGQTISQPLIVGFMTEMLALKPTDRVLEIGTGSGYQAAILSLLAEEVYTIEIVESLAGRAKATLAKLGYRNVFVRSGDGYRGWPDKAPFDAIIVTCAPDHIPQPLVEQLKVGGRIMIPVGPQSPEFGGQELVLVRKLKSGTTREKTMGVRFVPMTGEATERSWKKMVPGADGRP